MLVIFYDHFNFAITVPIERTPEVIFPYLSTDSLGTVSRKCEAVSYNNTNSAPTRWVHVISHEFIMKDKYDM